MMTVACLMPSGNGALGYCRAPRRDCTPERNSIPGCGCSRHVVIRASRRVS